MAASGTKLSGNGTHTGGGTTGSGCGTVALGFGQVLLIPCLGLFMQPFIVAGLGFRYFRIIFLLRLGHPLRKPLRTAFSSVEILGLHND